MFTAIISLYYTIMFTTLAAVITVLIFTLIISAVASRLADKVIKTYPSNRAARRGRWQKNAYKGKSVGEHMRTVSSYSPLGK